MATLDHSRTPLAGPPSPVGNGRTPSLALQRYYESVTDQAVALGTTRDTVRTWLNSPPSKPREDLLLRAGGRGEGMKRAETPRNPAATFGPKTSPFAGKTRRNAANGGKRTTGLEPATFGFGSR